jgi:hypothetical protein
MVILEEMAQEVIRGRKAKTAEMALREILGLRVNRVLVGKMVLRDYKGQLVLKEYKV